MILLMQAHDGHVRWTRVNLLAINLLDYLGFTMHPQNYSKANSAQYAKCKNIVFNSLSIMKISLRLDAPNCQKSCPSATDVTKSSLARGMHFANLALIACIKSLKRFYFPKILSQTFPNCCHIGKFLLFNLKQKNPESKYCQSSLKIR